MCLQYRCGQLLGTVNEREGVGFNLNSKNDNFFLSCSSTSEEGPSFLAMSLSIHSSNGLQTLVYICM